MFDISIVADSEIASKAVKPSFNPQDLTRVIDKPSAHSIFNYNASTTGMARAEAMLGNKAAGDIFYNSVNKINFGQVKINSLSTQMLDAVKDDSMPAHEAMLRRQIDVSVASLEVELVSKITGKSIENLYMLLKQ